MEQLIETAFDMITNNSRINKTQQRSYQWKILY